MKLFVPNPIKDYPELEKKHRRLTATRSLLYV